MKEELETTDASPELADDDIRSRMDELTDDRRFGKKATNQKTIRGTFKVKVSLSADWRKRTGV